LARGIRGGGLAWLLVVALAGFQAFAQRYAVGPDGVAYLDLSDAVVAGHWSGLVNLYWSPLYPLLVGLARLVTRASPAGEVPVMHAVNALAFLATFAAYEYFLEPVLRTAMETSHAILGGRWGGAIANGLFICVAFTLTPIELTTPDLLAAAAVFTAFGAILRFSPQRSSDGLTAAIVLGASLGLGGLAKSFMIPWAVFCLVAVAIAARKTGLKRIAVATLVWLVLVGPWIALLSRAASRFTFGDTGRLTYAWFVNNQDGPSLGGVPMGARTARTDAILPYTGITGDAPGTDPTWFDPERWWGPVAPHFELRDQLVSLATSGRFYVENLAPFLLLILLAAVAPAASRRDAWRRGWIVLVPAAAGMLGYAMVLVTARYFMPFVLAGIVVLLATLPAPRRVHPLALLIGIAIPIVLESIDDRSAVALALVVSIVGGMVAGTLMGGRVDGWTGGRRLLWAIGVLVAAGVTHVVLPAAFPGILLVGGAALAAALWAMSRAAIRAWRPVRFAHSLGAALALVVGTLLVLRFAGRLSDDRAALERAGSPRWGNLSANIAADLAGHGVGPGTRIAVIGPHADPYWARTGRLKIVASVPGPAAPMFWRLSRAQQDSLLAIFAAAGGQVAIASVGPASGESRPDSSWLPVRYRGWIRPLGDLSPPQP
jgi:hypothetical protein